MEKLSQNIVLFDLDGTLTDSAEGVIRSAQYMQEKMGLPVWKTADLKFIVGPPLMRTFQEDFAMSDAEAEKALLFFRERYSTVGLFENKVFPGIVEMLAELKAKGKRMAVATSKKEENAIRILQHFGIAHYFEVIGGDDREAGRDTKAKVMEYVLDTMGADRANAIMVGDRKFDVEGSHALNLPCIAVEFGYGDRAEFLACGADYIVATPAQVASMF